MSTLEQNLERRLAQYGEDDFVVKQLRRQIAAKNTGQSAQDLYVTGAVSEQPQTSKRVPRCRASEEEQRQFAKLYNDNLIITMTPPKVISSEEEDQK
jgi:hypothetical protein